MANHIWAKVFGWGQFLLQLGAQVVPAVTGPAQPHGAFSWFQFGTSLVTAIAVHAASNTDGNR